MAAHDALRTILPVAGLQPERAASVEITGGSDPVLRRRSASARPAPRRSPRPASPPPICGNCAAAASRTSPSNLRQATASLRSGHYLKVDGATMSTERKRRHGDVSGERTAAGATSTPIFPTIAPPR